MTLSFLTTHLIRRPAARLASLPGDERGVISIMSVVTIFVLTIVLGMVINAGRQVDEKIRMQNAADAATYSGAVVMARGYNALAFSNHVEAEVFALTAYFRTAKSTWPSSDPTTLNAFNEILDAWDTVGMIFARSKFPKFAAMGPAIQQKVPLEKAAVKSFLQMSGLQAKLVLPVFEYILRGPIAQQPGADPLGGVIPRFQRAVVLTTPQAAQTMASEIARMHGNMTSPGKPSAREKLHRSQPLMAILWRPNGTPISLGNEQDPFQRTMSVFDPNQFGPDDSAYSKDYYELARCQRKRWANSTLDVWNGYLLGTLASGWAQYWNPFPPPAVSPGGATSAKMSLFLPVWRILTLAQLSCLLNVDYRGTNLPYVYRIAGALSPTFASDQQCTICPQQPNPPNQPPAYNCDCLEGFRSTTQVQPGYLQYVYENMDPLQNSQQPLPLDQYHMFVGVAYWPAMRQTSAIFFRYPLATDSMAFAQASVFVPRARYLKSGPRNSDGNWLIYEGTNQTTGLPMKRNSYDGDLGGWPQRWDPWLTPQPVNLQWLPIWDLSNQNWMAQLVPATSNGIPAILQSSQAQQLVPNIRTPNFGSLQPVDLRRVNTH
jgi:hypothetical protein